MRENLSAQNVMGPADETDSVDSLKSINEWTFNFIDQKIEKIDYNFFESKEESAEIIRQIPQCE